MSFHYRVVRPSAGIVSQHRKLDRALESLERQRRGARAQGGWAEDFIEKWDPVAGQWRTWHGPSLSWHPRDGQPARW